MTVTTLKRELGLGRERLDSIEDALGKGMPENYKEARAEPPRERSLGKMLAFTKAAGRGHRFILPLCTRPQVSREVLMGARAHLVQMALKVLVPILLTKEGKWFVASSPILDVAAQGRTEKEVKENLADLINEYLRDPDTTRPSLEELMSLSLANIPVQVPKSVLHGKTSPSSAS